MCAWRGDCSHAGGMEARRNAWATWGAGLGALPVVLGWLPAIPLLAVACSLVGLCRARTRGGWGRSLAGLALGLLCLNLAGGYWAGWSWLRPRHPAR